jgi:outer membrane DcaP-like protein
MIGLSKPSPRVAAALIAAAAFAPAMARAQAAGASPDTLQQMQRELSALQAEEATAKAQEAAARAAERARAARIDALARQLSQATGQPIVQTPAPTEIAEIPAQPKGTSKPGFDVYGFAQLDMIQDFDRVDPNWTATLRPSRIGINGEFGSDGQSIASVRQSRFGVTASQDILGKPLFVKFEFDLYGVGVDAGQTTMRVRHAYGSWGPILAGQTNSVFMDIDTFPNVIDYWGPDGMVFLRTPQIRYTYKSGGSEFAVALESSSNDVDPGGIRVIDPALGSTIHGDQKVPDLTAHYRYDGGWGHVQLAGILRNVAFDSSGTPGNEPKGNKTGWGLNLAGNFNTWHKDVLHLSVVYGEGIASYMNDGGTDLGPKVVLSGPIVAPPIAGLPAGTTLAPDVLPLLGLVAYYDHYWNDHWSTSIGWSQTKVENTSFQEGSAYRNGEYASVNLLWNPDKHIMMGGELLWGTRQLRSGASGDDTRVQFSFKYSFSSTDFQ